ncbi:hypothetical protein ACLQ28_18955 [Micromonospora sp. DT201]|uniref:hypothetical protein n=1 Tax=Micromonospora sp. DT201 TaxID=3393442 RepID=UPI003CF6119C
MPAERELADRFDASRTTVHVALRTMRRRSMPKLPGRGELDVKTSLTSALHRPRRR